MLVILVNEKLYQLTLTLRDLEVLKKLGVGFDYFLKQIPGTKELALFFMIALQGSNLEEGYGFIDDFYEEGNTFQQLVELIPKLYLEVGILSEATEQGEISASSDLSLEEIIKINLKKSIQFGLTEKQFYSMTLAEVIRFSESIEPQRIRQLKEQALMDYTHAELIALNVGCLLSKKAKVPMMEDVYAHLYTDDELQKMKASREEHKQQQATQTMKFGMLAWVEAMNAKNNRGKDTAD